ncbi:MAG: ABC transporter ATP-binding protein, partial [Planctomycetes bacterium]|nr:ABC transporter ATP-binding protein [Planctomycetota bacterium]
AYPLALKQVIDGVERALRAAAGGERGSGGEALPPGRQDGWGEAEGAKPPRGGAEARGEADRMSAERAAEDDPVNRPRPPPPEARASRAGGAGEQPEWRGRSDDAGGEASLGSLFLVLALVLAGRFVAGFYPGFRAWMNLRIESDLRSETFDRILEKDYRFQRAFRTGDVVTRLTDDIGEYPRLAWFCCSGIFRAIDSAARLLFSLAAMLVLEPRLAALSVAPLPVMLYLFYLVRRRLTDKVEAQQAAISRTNDLLEAAFSGIRIVKAFAAEEGQRRKLAAVLAERAPVQLAVARLQALFGSGQALAARAGQVVTIAFGGWLVARGRLPLGTLYAFYLYLDILVYPMQDLPALLVTARQAFVSAERVEELRRFGAPGAAAGRKDDIPGAAQGCVAAPIDRIALDRATVIYEGAQSPALDEISISIRRGERLAIVGAIGSGKSTLLKALVGLVPLAHGQIIAGGCPIAGEAGWRTFRERLGYVPQDSLLFSESIRENVGLGRAASEAVDRAIQAAQLASDLPRLERGADTILGDKGSLLSGGQRQRVAIARALARRPDALLLDDSTAALDARSEELFWGALDREFPDTFTLVATHRLATVRRATRVLFLDRGRIVAAGTHEELLGASPAYAELLAADARSAALAEPE